MHALACGFKEMTRSGRIGISKAHGTPWAMSGTG
jgi:hypothetical protein